MRVIIDKKTGKAQPWTALQLAGYSLLDTPVDFDKETHTYMLDGVSLPSVTRILKATGFIDDRFFDDESARRGSMIHLMTHYDDMETLHEWEYDPEIQGYIDAWKRFKKETGFVTEKSEVPMASKIYRFAGTFDAVGNLPNSTITRMAVELNADGTYKAIPYQEDRNDKQIFLAAVACYHWQVNQKLRKG